MKGGESLTTEEFERLLEIYGNDIYSFCLYIMHNRANAEDLYQDTVLTAFRKADKIDLSENPRSYLLSVAVKLSHNYFRKEKRRNERTASSSPEEIDNISDNTDVQSDVEESALKSALRKVVSELDGKYRIPVVLYYFDEHDLAYISGIMKIPKGTVKSRLHKAREIIAEKLKQEGYENG